MGHDSTKVHPAKKQKKFHNGTTSSHTTMECKAVPEPKKPGNKATDGNTEHYSDGEVMYWIGDNLQESDTEWSGIGSGETDDDLQLSDHESDMQ